MGEISCASEYYTGLSEAMRMLPYAQIDELAAVLFHAYKRERTVYLFGNGGSASLASHLACDLGKGTACHGERRFRALALTDNISVMTAWANDASYGDIFAEQIRHFIQKDDIAFAISASGNSPNVLNCLSVARDAGAFTVGLTGYQGGKMRSLCDLCIVAPSSNMQVIEDLHLSISHCVFSILFNRMAEFCGKDRE